MDRKEFRHRYVIARLTQLFGCPSGADPVALELLRKNCRTYDPLQARMSSLTPDARTRIVLYPILGRLS